MAGPDIRQGHALDLIEGVDAFDCLFTDPPYAFGNQGTTEHAISATVATVLRESARRLRKGGWAVVFCASSWRSTAYMIEATRGILEPIRFGTWCKGEARTKVRTPGWAWATVNVIVFKKGKSSWGDPSLALDWIKELPVMNGRRAELPPRVAEWAVSPFCLDGGLALDPFAGTGRLLEAASRRGMETIGFEVDPAAALFYEQEAV